jgi:hypothetical protein
VEDGTVSGIATLQHERTVQIYCSVKTQNPSAMKRKDFEGSGARELFRAVLFRTVPHHCRLGEASTKSLAPER